MARIVTEALGESRRERFTQPGPRVQTLRNQAETGIAEGFGHLIAPRAHGEARQSLVTLWRDTASGMTDWSRFSGRQRESCVSIDRDWVLSTSVFPPPTV